MHARGAAPLRGAGQARSQISLAMAPPPAAHADSECRWYVRQPSSAFVPFSILSTVTHPRRRLRSCSTPFLAVSAVRGLHLAVATGAMSLIAEAIKGAKVSMLKCFDIKQRRLTLRLICTRCTSLVPQHSRSGCTARGRWCVFWQAQ